MTTYYEMLKLPHTATSDEIKSGYMRERARCIAAAGDASLDAIQLLWLDEAYATLVDPSQRAAYDRILAQEGANAAPLASAGSASLLGPMTANVPLPMQACPHCNNLNPLPATSCQICGGQISNPCPRCGQAVRIPQKVCPRCEAYVPEYNRARFVEALAREQDIQQERGQSAERRAAADTIYRAEVRFGAIFWAVALIVALGLLVLASVLWGFANH